MHCGSILEQEKTAVTQTPKMLGCAISHHREAQTITICTESGSMVLQFLCADLFRVVLSPDTLADLSSTDAIVEHGLSFSDFTLNEDATCYHINTSKLKIVIQKVDLTLFVHDADGVLRTQNTQPFQWYKKSCVSHFSTPESARFYGMGEKTGYLDKKGRKYVMWNTDIFDPHVDTTDPLYLSVPFFIHGYQGNYYGLYFDNFARSQFDLGRDDSREYAFGAEGGKMDFYYIGGDSLKAVVSRFSQLTGRAPMPPKWSLGFQQSRYSYRSEQEVRDIALTLRQKKIPCDTLVLDIHYMDGYRVFSWDPNAFPNPAQLMADLKQEGFNVVTIVDPGVKKDSHYNVYVDGAINDLYCKYADGTTYEGKVWPGVSVFPDLASAKVRRWWGEQVRSFADKAGVRGIWHDMNEPAVFNDTNTMDEDVLHRGDNKTLTHLEYHNMYGFHSAQASYRGMVSRGERPFILTRAGFAGVQRYAAVWTGDNRSLWEHLHLTMPMLMNLGLSGINYAGVDCGGFTGDSNGELLTRWTQMGAFTPFFRNHCNIDGRHQEAWRFGEIYEKAIRDAIELRYRFMPYLYDRFFEAHQTGIPMMRPLIMEFPTQSHLESISDQFMMGDSLLVAPMLRPEQEHRVVTLPEGDWYDYFTAGQYRGGVHLYHAPLARFPLLVRAGAILPQTEVSQYLGEKPQSLTFKLYLDENISDQSYCHYADDGLSFGYQEGCYWQFKLDYHYEGGELVISTQELHQGYDPEFDFVQIEIVTGDPERISLNGQESGEGTLRIPLSS